MPKPGDGLLAVLVPSWAWREGRDLTQISNPCVRAPCWAWESVSGSCEPLHVLLQHLAQRKAPSASRDGKPGERGGGRKREGGEDTKPPGHSGNMQLAGD